MCLITAANEMVTNIEITNIRINFQYKKLIPFEELMKCDIVMKMCE
jgi:hypothetical protein